MRGHRSIRAIFLVGALLGAAAWAAVALASSPTTIFSVPGNVVVACSSSSHCTAGNEAGEVVTFNPASPGKPKASVVRPAASHFGIEGIACPSASQCTATLETYATSNAGAVTFNPAAPGTPTPITFAGPTAAGEPSPAPL